MPAMARALMRGGIAPRDRFAAETGGTAAVVIAAISWRRTKMKKLKLAPEHLRVESFAMQSQGAKESGMMTLGVTLCLPYTCPECSRTRMNGLCG